MYQVKLKPSAAHDLVRLSKTHRVRAQRALLGLQSDPEKGKKLEGDMRGLRSLRVWPLRVIYKILKSELLILVIRIGHRQGVYKR